MVAYFVRESLHSYCVCFFVFTRIHDLVQKLPTKTQTTHSQDLKYYDSPKWETNIMTSIECIMNVVDDEVVEHAPPSVTQEEEKKRNRVSG